MRDNRALEKYILSNPVKNVKPRESFKVEISRIKARGGNFRPFLTIIVRFRRFPFVFADYHSFLSISNRFRRLSLVLDDCSFVLDDYHSF
jgi:hypothetical protein